jgi:hypothetical protein
MFEIRTKELKIENDTYILKPLKGDSLPALWGVLTKLGKEVDEEGKPKLESLDEETMRKIFNLCFDTFKKSYPSESPEKLEYFVSQNLWSIFPAVMELNTAKIE